ncbi:ornithine aminomutase subunit alpha [Mycoplasmatota bacterium]|nr:ornithine aminomutase subunit alpha [Mycoplasmatota bacterium]
MTRKDDFEVRRKHLENLTDEELKIRFWDLAYRVIDPLITLAKENTSPAIERSVLLRMGFSSIEAKAIVDRVIDYGLIGKGAGHVVYKLAQLKKMSIREAGLNLLEGDYWDEVLNSFEVVK